MSQWRLIDEFLTFHGFALGGPTLCQSDGPKTVCGMHSDHSLHYEGRARDYGYTDNAAVDIARFLEPYARGPDYVIQELFCDVGGAGIWWAEGAPAYGVTGHREHTHGGIRDGARFPDQAPVPLYTTYEEVDVQFPTLSQGSGGLMVKRVQGLLYVLGHDPGTTDADRFDGNFGPRTTAAVVGFQNAHGIGADGVVGALTWSRLLQSPS